MREIRKYFWDSPNSIRIGDSPGDETLQIAENEISGIEAISSGKPDSIIRAEFVGSRVSISRQTEITGFFTRHGCTPNLQPKSTTSSKRIRLLLTAPLEGNDKNAQSDKAPPENARSDNAQSEPNIVDWLIWSLTAMGHRVQPGPEQEAAAQDADRVDYPECGLIISGPVALPSSYQEFLSNDTPHLNLAICRKKVELRGWVVPGETGCLRCREVSAEDLDPAWPIVAAQLATRPIRRVTALECHQACMLVLSALYSENGMNGSLAPTLTPKADWPVSQKCGCQLWSGWREAA